MQTLDDISTPQASEERFYHQYQSMCVHNLCSLILNAVEHTIQIQLPAGPLRGRRPQVIRSP